MSTGISIMERRRRQRVSISVPMMVTSLNAHDKFHEMVETIDVSSSGAQLRLRRSLPPDTRLRLDIINSNRVTEGRVIHCDREGQKFWRVGIQLLQQTGNFWGLKSPPKDWEDTISLDNEQEWHG